jgi:fatty-acyl-CoA synthase
VSSDTPISYPLDRHLQAAPPALTTLADQREFERVPYAERIAVHSTLDALRAGATSNPSGPAIQFLPNADPTEQPLVISQADFLGQVIRSANMLHGLGVGPNDVVSLMLPLVPQAFYALFGAEAAGIANPINPMLEPHQLAEIMRAAKTRALIALGPTDGTDIWSKVERIRGQLPDLRHVVRVGGDAVTESVDFDEQIGKFPADQLDSGRQIAASDVAAYFHTGGTTGTPKLVPHTHGNQVYQAWSMNLMMPGGTGDTLLFGLPLFHVGGALTQGLAPLARGASLVVLSAAGWRHPSAIANIWRHVARFRPTTLGGVPTVLGAAASIPIGDADTSSLTSTSGGGSAIPVAVGEALQSSLGQPVIEVYGMTETSSVHTLSFPMRPIKLGAVGHALPYSSVRIIKVDGEGQLSRDCDVNEIGVVAMSGPGVFTGYLNDAHNEGAFVEPGWVNSGDLGRVDEDGYLWITGRAKDLIIRGGHNIDPAGVEEVLYKHAAIQVAAMVGQPDSYAGELPLAYVELKSGASATRDELLAFVREHTPERAAVPVDVIIQDTIPLTGVGKVFKPALRWDAAQRVFSGLLAPLQADGIGVDVQVGAHGTHGALATVNISGLAGADRIVFEAKVAEQLAPFSLQHQVAWQ